MLGCSLLLTGCCVCVCALWFHLSFSPYEGGCGWTIKNVIIIKIIYIFPFFYFTSLLFLYSSALPHYMGSTQYGLHIQIDSSSLFLVSSFFYCIFLLKNRFDSCMRFASLVIGVCVHTCNNFVVGTHICAPRNVSLSFRWFATRKNPSISSL